MRVYLWTAPDEASESDAFWKFCLDEGLDEPPGLRLE